MEDKENFKCVNCGANTYKAIDSKTVECEYCHTKYRIKSKSPKINIETDKMKAAIDFGDVKEKVTSFVEEKPLTVQKWVYVACCFILGVFGLEYMLLNKKVAFILSVLFLWTGVPALIGIVKGIMVAFQDPLEFKKVVDKDKSCWLYRIGQKYSIQNNTQKENQIS